jgi:PAS domain-containing protein
MTAVAPADANALIEAIYGIVWEVLGPQLCFSFVSAQSERILGYHPRQWLADARFWVGHIHPQDREATSSCRMACTTAAGAREHTYRMRRADGEYVWLQHKVFDIAADSGAPARHPV